MNYQQMDTYQPFTPSNLHQYTTPPLTTQRQERNLWNFEKDFNLQQTLEPLKDLTLKRPWNFEKDFDLSETLELRKRF